MVERKHPEIRVRTVHHPWRDYWDWLRAVWRRERQPAEVLHDLIPEVQRLVDASVAR